MVDALTSYDGQLLGKGGGGAPRVGFLRATDVSNNMGGGGGRETNERLLYLFWPIAGPTSIVL